MVLGFNHNIRYKGELFHVQTEDSGRANPHIITLLYRGGTIIGSAKTGYADIIKVDQLEQVVESIMKEQHKEMMRRLKGGEFDLRIFPCAPAQPAAGTEAAAEPASPASPAPVSQSAAAAKASEALPAGGASRQNQPPLPGPAAAAMPSPERAAAAPPTKRSLDEVILDYLITGEE